MARTAYRITALAASGALAIGVGVTGAHAAIGTPSSAQSTPVSVSSESAAQEAQWPEYRQTEMGWNVSVAKHLLWEQDYYEPGGTLDDRFDEATVESLLDYQQDTDLKVTGILDGRSWEFLVEDAGTLSQGDEGPAVAAAQTALHEKLGYDLTDDGYRTYAPEPGSFGPATHEAVVDFQEENGLAADGAVDADTFEALVVTPEQ
ncbi:peptidoglycan-binding domain-containing protein [Nocardiopsis sp. MG754419]|uniref:peptidoglycan-binding domain-containing protein n=1 Tax=Nocardiopsis sp. MG754419 TaxID=2259865 RepID=UPI001BAB811F|nr:peptidoglycan-binding domain-containing protein [Nocardiopsis sp. MG754419]MBR8744392.1 hypothetical protein [Nocardiopsis sp. MG754419]